MLLLKNATIYPQTEEAPFVGDILCRDGRIAAIGQGLAPEDVPEQPEVLDLTGLHLLPGLIDCHAHVGLMNGVTEATRPITADMHAIYGVDVSAPYFPFAVKNGVTTLGLIPGSANVICGMGVAARTWGDNIFDMCLRNNMCMKAALGENPKGWYQNRGVEPDSRMGATFLLEEFLYNAHAYWEKKDAGEAVERQPDYEAMGPVFRKEIPLRIHCTHNDMLSAIQCATRYGLWFTLEHAWGSTNYLDEIAESGCGIVYGPIGGRRSFYESRMTDIEAVAELDRRGVEVSLTTDSPILGLDSLLTEMEEAVRQGTELLRALRMVTIHPARVLGLADRVGSIEVGKDANFAVFQGLPGRDMGAEVACTVCEGQVRYRKEA